MDRDLSLRLAVFARIAALREIYAGLIPAAELSAGIEFEGQHVPIWNQAKGIFRPAALRDPGAALTLVTSAKRPYDDRLDSESDRIWYSYRGTDPQQADNVAARRAMETRRPLLYLVGVEPGLYSAVFPVYIMEDHPQRLEFGLAADLVFSADALEEPTVRAEIRREYATRAVQHRLHQYRFRADVLNAYGNACAICRLRHTPLLDAAHILPDRDPRGRPEVPNGLGLCKIHHSAFDSTLLGIDGDYLVHVRGDVLKEEDGPMLRHGLQAVHGMRLHLPRRIGDRPNPGYLAERFESFRAA